MNTAIAIGTGRASETTSSCRSGSLSARIISRDRNYRNYAIPQRDYARFISQTTNTTNYVTINNYVVNRSIDQNRLPRSTSQRFQPVPASNVFGRNSEVTQAGVGRQVEQRERQQRPIPVNINPVEQRGRGNQNSSAQQQNPVQGPQGPALDTSRQNGRGLANINPSEQRGRGNTNSPQPNQGSQDPRSRGDNRGFNSNGAVQPNLQTSRPANPAVNNGGQANLQIDRGNRSSHALQTGGAPVPPNGKVILQDSRTSLRAPGNAPAAATVVNEQSNGRDSQTPEQQGDAKNAGDQNAADPRKKN